MVLELYLAIPGFANRKYVVERLQGKHFFAFINYLFLDLVSVQCFYEVQRLIGVFRVLQLAMGPLLSHFSWDSTGVTWEGGRKTWTADLPTDSQIIMHLFTVYMDLAMPAQPSQSYDRFPFSYKHYVPMEAKPDATTSLQIKQTAKYPPNYNLVVEGAMWEVIPVSHSALFYFIFVVYFVVDHLLFSFCLQRYFMQCCIFLTLCVCVCVYLHFHY